MLGYLEETILLLILSRPDESFYAVSLADAYKKLKGKSISVPAIHTALSRLEKKNLLTSQFGEATNARGGKRKRLYEITNEGRDLVNQLREERDKLWVEISKYNLA